jgi:acyl carrier protein
MCIESFFKSELIKLCASESHTDDSDVFGPEGWSLDTPLICFGLDSIRAFDLICALEDKYGIEIADKDIPRLKTARLVIEYISAQTGR